jgi:hypothetical protein
VTLQPRWPEFERIPPPPAFDDLPVRRRPVQCARCPAVAAIVGYALDAVHSQIALYQAGWRRGPDTGLHYCPGHADAAGGPR